MPFPYSCGPGVLAVPPVTLDEQIAEVDRELQFRERVYPRWVNSVTPRLSRMAAAQHLARMRAVRASLVQLKALQEVKS